MNQIFIARSRYGHWYSPGNNFSFNYCLQTNSHWGQNGMYLDDVATGQTVVPAIQTLQC